MATIKYAKFIDKHTIERLKLPIRIDGEDIFTNDPEVLLQYGFKPLVYTEPPDVDEGYYADSFWKNCPKTIRQDWEILPIEGEQ